MRENQWWIASIVGGSKPMWLCSACGGECIRNINPSKDLTFGQDLKFNYIIFIQFKLHDGLRTLCAMAQAPSELLQNQLITLKLVLMFADRELHKGAVTSIVDMMVNSKNKFVAAMDVFPKTKRTIVHPSHIGHGDSLSIMCDGITSLHQSELGSEMNFLDINLAYRNGMFGESPKIWKDDEWSLLLDYLCGGIAHSKEDWENLEYSPQVWDTETGRVAKPTTSKRSLIRGLAERAANADPYLKHQMSIKSFKAADALSVVTESTAFDSEGEACEDSDAAFREAEKEVWSKAAKREAKNTKARARGTAGAARGNALGKAKRAERAAKRSSGAASSSMITA